MSTGTTVRGRTANEVSHEIIGAALKVHSELGPGLLERRTKHVLRLSYAKLGMWSKRRLRCRSFTEIFIWKSDTGSTWLWMVS